MPYLRKGFSFSVLLPVRTTSGDPYTTTATAPTVQLVRDNNAPANVTTPPVHTTGGLWRLTLNSTEANADMIGVSWSGSGIQADSAVIYTEGDYTVEKAGFIDASISSRLATTGYTAPLTAAGIRAAVGLALANLDRQLYLLGTIGTNNGAGINAISGLVQGVDISVDQLWAWFASMIDTAPDWTVDEPTFRFNERAIALINSLSNVSGSGAVATKLETMLQQIPGSDPAAYRYLAAALAAAPSGGGGSGTVQYIVSPDSVPPAVVRLTAGDTNATVQVGLRDASGNPIPLPPDATATFTLRQPGAASATATGAGEVVWAGGGIVQFAFSALTPVPAEGRYEATFKVSGATFPLGRTIPVIVHPAL